ncbi:hypothetical protein LEP1GSC050_2754 [Leptospira broomii serovar Hurstbridge str. 5399]|uniref:Uncharacterized protein n=1 Tax=Leptospira broomii serovar Hurstbridge str. 5399 TaxID=1049789 RepID=T0F9H6_9LEPT|nr:hypothetical protein [Leptospira broomii]EQA44182.1 hypothetical protein LEP1GSC050_2754 [Leptospira broomii serovar Hurstbridge str. 5399]
MKNKKNWIYAGLLIASLLILFVLWEEAKEEGLFLTEKEKKEKAEFMARGVSPSASGTSDSGYFQSLDESIPPEKILKDYLEWSEYPPNSRPLTKYNEDLLNPYFIGISAVPMADKPTDKQPNGYSCKLQPLQWAAIGTRDPLYITLECYDNKFQRVPLDVRNVKLTREFDGNKFGAISPDGNDNGVDGDVKAKDNLFTFQWRPTSKDWGDMFLEVEFVYGKEKKEGKIISSFFSSPNQPAEWSSYFSDSPSDGSLSVRAALNVFRSGTYHLEANLIHAASGEPIAWASYDGKLNGGRQEIDFLFFGKLIRESGFDGPYALSQLRGHRVNLPIDPEWFSQGADGMRKILAAKTTEPDKELIAPYKENYVTRTYDQNTFSYKAWQSPEKEQQVKQLQEHIK